MQPLIISQEILRLIEEGVDKGAENPGCGAFSAGDGFEVMMATSDPKEAGLIVQSSSPNVTCSQISWIIK